MLLFAGYGEQVPEPYSGPILNRIDIRLEVQRVTIAKFASLGNGEPSNVIRACSRGGFEGR